MTSKELKAKIQQKNKTKLIELVLKLYKVIPKKILEEKCVDDFFLDEIYLLEKQVEKKPSISDEKNAHELFKNMSTFTNNFLNGHYGIPNRIVPKAKRSKWRFEVKKMVKEFDIVYSKCNIQKDLCDSLLKLYNALCYANGIYIVNSDDTFASIQITQPDLLLKVISIVKNHYDKEALYKILIDLIINNNLSRECLHTELFDVLVNSFENNLAKEELRDYALKYLDTAVGKELLDLPKNHKSHYRINDRVKDLVEGIIVILIKLNDEKKAINFLFDSYEKYKFSGDKEIAIYIIVRLFDTYSMDYDTYNKMTLERAVSENVKLRSSLADRHRALCLK